MKIQIINGPNLNLLGTREPGIYGNCSFDTYLQQLRTHYPEVQIDYYQSNVEGELINIMQQVGFTIDGIILNAGAYSHTSYSIRDAVAAINIPVVMVHISNVYARENFRHENVIAAKCKGVIPGFGLRSYELAVRSFAE